MSLRSSRLMKFFPFFFSPMSLWFLKLFWFLLIKRNIFVLKSINFYWTKYFSFLKTASINAIACPIGGLLCSYVLDKYGRKKTLYTINLLSVRQIWSGTCIFSASFNLLNFLFHFLLKKIQVISWGMMAMASSVDKELMFIQLLVARFIIGICIGLSSSPSAVYSAEIAHPTLRGRISVITSVTIGAGILLVYCLGYFIPVRKFTNWNQRSHLDTFLVENWICVHFRQFNEIFDRKLENIPIRAKVPDTAFDRAHFFQQKPSLNDPKCTQKHFSTRK